MVTIGTFSGSLKAGQDAIAVTAGGFSGTLDAGADGVLVSEGAINGLNVQAKKDLFVLGYGAITGSYQAGRNAGVVTYSTFNAGLRADRRVDYVYAAGSISGAITGDYAIGAPTDLAGPSGPFAVAGSDGIFTFGSLSATVNALNTSTTPDGGVILGVGAVGSITGTITASSLITRVHSGSTITPAPSAPTVGTITEHDPSLQSLTAPTATPTDPATLRADSTAARATLVSERAAIDLFFTNYADSLDATATDLTNQVAEQRTKLSEAVTAAQTKAGEAVGGEFSRATDRIDAVREQLEDDLTAFQAAITQADIHASNAVHRVKADRNSRANWANLLKTASTVANQRNDAVMAYQHSIITSVSKKEREDRDVDWWARNSTHVNSLVAGAEYYGAGTVGAVKGAVQAIPAFAVGFGEFVRDTAYSDIDVLIITYEASTGSQPHKRWSEVGRLGEAGKLDVKQFYTHVGKNVISLGTYDEYLAVEQWNKGEIDDFELQKRLTTGAFFQLIQARTLKGTAIGEMPIQDIPGHISRQTVRTATELLADERGMVDPLLNKLPNWKVWEVNRYDKTVRWKKGRIFRDPDTGLWWSRDVDGHGGSAWKVFEETSTGLEWIHDADIFGNYMDGKHKGPQGQFIPWSETGQ